MGGSEIDSAVCLFLHDLARERRSRGGLRDHQWLIPCAEYLGHVEKSLPKETRITTYETRAPDGFCDTM